LAPWGLTLCKRSSQIAAVRKKKISCCEVNGGMTTRRVSFEVALFSAEGTTCISLGCKSQGVLGFGRLRGGDVEQVENQRQKLLFSTDDVIELVEIIFQLGVIDLFPTLGLIAHQKQASIAGDVGY
jgi:hypothetical protein